MINKKHLILLALILSSLFGLQAIESFRATSGEVILGKMDIQKSGIFVFTDEGGKLYPWHKIDPISLPKPLVNEKHEEALTALNKAQALYDSGSIKTASSYFKKAYSLRHFLTKQEKSSEAFTDINMKASGYVMNDGKWISYNKLQSSKGLIFYAGKWRTKEDYNQYKEFRFVILKAKGSHKPKDAIQELNVITRKYPKSEYRAAADEMIARLEAFQRYLDENSDDLTLSDLEELTVDNYKQKIEADKQEELAEAREKRRNVFNTYPRRVQPTMNVGTYSYSPMYYRRGYYYRSGNAYIYTPPYYSPYRYRRVNRNRNNHHHHHHHKKKSKALFNIKL